MKLLKHLPGRIKHWLNKFYYSMFEKERVPVKVIHDYWKNPIDETKLTLNMYRDGVKNTIRSNIICEAVNRFVQKEEGVLELGCNSGINLFKLYRLGFKDVNGIDICQTEIDKLKAVTPVMWNIKAKTASIENLLLAAADNSYDVIFTKNVLEHCHYESDFIFKEMVRVAGRYIIILEDEVGKGWRHFPRNYKKIFEELGMTEVEATNLKYHWGDDMGFKFWLRVFKK